MPGITLRIVRFDTENGSYRVNKQRLVYRLDEKTIYFMVSNPFIALSRSKAETIIMAGIRDIDV